MREACARDRHHAAQEKVIKALTAQVETQVNLVATLTRRCDYLAAYLASCAHCEGSGFLDNEHACPGCDNTGCVSEGERADQLRRLEGGEVFYGGGIVGDVSDPRP